MLSIIVAIAKNNAIGKNNSLLWHLSEDLKFFKRTTSGHSVIMGRKTFESIGRKPLPKRMNIVISRSSEINSDSEKTNNSTILLYKKSLEEAIDASQNIGNVEFSQNHNSENKELEIFVIGGGQIYKQALPLADKLYLTVVDVEIKDADTFFPEIDFSQWKLVERGENKSEKGYNFHVEIYQRKVVA